MARRGAGGQLPGREGALLSLLLLFRVVEGRHFLSSPVFPCWAAQRDSVAAARATRCSRERQRREAAAVGARLKHACVAAGSGRRAVQRVQRSGARLGCRRLSCAVLLSCLRESPCNVGRCGPADAVQRVQSTAAGPGWQGLSGARVAQRAAGLAVVDEFDGPRFQEREGGRWSLVVGRRGPGLVFACARPRAMR